MNQSIQIGTPGSSQRIVWAGLIGTATFTVLALSKRGFFWSAMVGVFAVGLTSCVPLALDSANTERPAK